ncbi:MAG: MBOAT family protein [Kiritimatiellae bacterium]|nr:MBOAT family protein [Kiritimatiellia bacterium]
MLFNSYEFLFLFLPLVLLGYYALVPRRARLLLLTLASYFFYGWWDYRFCSLMLISTLIDYAAGKGIGGSADPRIRRRWMIASIVSNLSLLGFFKYYDLAARTVNQALSFFGAPDPLLPLLHIILPVGISFYTFQSMSYSIDIYLGAARPARSFVDFACFVALYPQLIAGPIVRYRDLAEQLIERSHTVAKFALGITFFVLGLAKKVILADGVAPLVGPAFEAAAPGLFTAWTGLLAYTMQIYFDFSGYSDMAVGLGLMLGFRMPQNFDSPYKAVSITDFWRRWHITLSSWLRDYLYIPLGGNRLGPVRTYFNLFLTMLLGGLWHGANWTFVLWGAYHGILLAIERAAGKKGLLAWAPAAAQQLVTFGLAMFGWVLFRAATPGQVRTMFRGLFGANGAEAHVRAAMAANPLPYLMLAVTLLLAFGFRNTWEIQWRNGWTLALFLAALFAASVAAILVNTSSPFLYFQF